MRKILSIFCLLCLFAVPLVLTACESPQEDTLEETEGATVETFEEGAYEVDETMDMGTEMDTDMHLDVDVDVDVEAEEEEEEPPAE